MSDGTPKHFFGRNYEEVRDELNNLGFDNIIIEEIRDIEKAKDKRIDKVASITIDKSPKFAKGDWINEEAEIKITYHVKM